MGIDEDSQQTSRRGFDGSIDSQGLADRIITINRRRRRLRGAGGLVAGVALAVAAIAAANVSGLTGGVSHDAQSTSSVAHQATVPAALGGDFVSPVQPGEPCVAPQSVALANLSKLTQVHAWMPNAPAANLSNLDHVWLCASQPVLGFGPITVGYEAGWSDKDATADWADFASHTGGYVTSVNGVPAVYMPAAGAGTVGQVLLVSQGTLIRIQGEPQVEAADLLAVATSIDFSKPL